MDWAISHEHQEWCAFIILDVYNTLENHPHILAVDYVEFEDLVRFSDVFIGNCGAGSTMTAMAAGLVQTCQIAGSVGADKSFNQQVIKHLGPNTPHFAEVMFELQTNFQRYHANALQTKFVISNEIKQTIRNMQEFFTELAADASSQVQFTRTRQIPSRFALE